MLTTIRVAMFSFGCLCVVGCAQVSERSVQVAQVDGDNHITVRAEGGRLWWSHRAWSEPHELWKLPSDAPVTNLAVREIASGDGPRFEITFEQNGEPWHGDMVLDDNALNDAPVAFLRGTERLATDGFMSELARSGR